MIAAAQFPRMKAAAALYGVDMVTDKPDSPHLMLASDIKGELYVGFAENDPAVPATVVPALDAALKEAGTTHRTGNVHGHASRLLLRRAPDYNAVAAEATLGQAVRPLGPQPQVTHRMRMPYASQHSRPDGKLHYEVHGERLSRAAVRAGIPELAHRALAHQPRHARACRRTGSIPFAALSRPLPADRARRAQRGRVARAAHARPTTGTTYTATHLALLDHLGVDAMPRHGRVHRRVVRAVRSRRRGPDLVSALVLQNPIGLSTVNRAALDRRVRQVGRRRCAAGPDIDPAQLPGFPPAHVRRRLHLQRVARIRRAAARFPMLLMPGDDMVHRRRIARTTSRRRRSVEVLVPWKGVALRDMRDAPRARIPDRSTRSAMQ